jgi:hypothetical protein
MFRALVCFITVATLLIGSSFAQQKSPWPNWKKSEVEKLLNGSPWGQTQTDTDTSEMTYSPTAIGRSAIGAPTVPTGSTRTQAQINNQRADRGATNQPVSVNYHIRFLSAKPIRQAVARLLELQEKEKGNVAEQMRPFVERDFSQYIVVAVTFDSTDSRFSGPALQAFASSTAGTLKNDAYLERGDGKRLFIMDYKPPINDGLGAKFIFPRIVSERPFLGRDDTVRFFVQLTDSIQLTMNFKLSDMNYEGRLEY